MSWSDWRVRNHRWDLFCEMWMCIARCEKYALEQTWGCDDADMVEMPVAQFRHLLKLSAAVLVVGVVGPLYVE